MARLLLCVIAVAALFGGWWGLSFLGLSFNVGPDQVVMGIAAILGVTLIPFAVWIVFMGKRRNA